MCIGVLMPCLTSSHFFYMIEMCANVLKGRSKSFIKKNKPCSLMGSGLCLDWFHSNIDVAGGGHRQPISSCKSLLLSV